MQYYYLFYLYFKIISGIKAPKIFYDVTNERPPSAFVRGQISPQSSTDWGEIISFQPERRYYNYNILVCIDAKKYTNGALKKRAGKQY